MTVNYFSAMPIYSEVWSAAVDGGGSKLWMLEDNEDNQREDCSRKRTNSLFSFLHLRHISCCCCWAGEQCNCITSCNLPLVAPCLVQINSLHSFHVDPHICVVQNSESRFQWLSHQFTTVSPCLAWCKHWV